MDLPLDLRQEAAQYGLVAKPDPRRGFQRSLAGRLWNSHLASWSGTIRARSRDLLEATCDQPSLFVALAALQDIMVLERSADSLTIAFPAESLPAVAKTMGVRSREEIRGDHRRLARAGAESRSACVQAALDLLA